MGCLKLLNAPATIFISRMEKANPEKDVAQNLLSLISKNKRSVEEGKTLIAQARAAGLTLAEPARAQQRFPRKGSSNQGLREGAKSLWQCRS